MNTPNYLPIISIATNIVMVVIGALLARWIGGVLQNFEAKIEIAILKLEQRLEQKLGRDYATKEELAKVEDQVRLGERVDEGFNNVLDMLRVRRSRGRRATEVIVP